MFDRKILIIDDEADIREVAAMSLETMCGWSVLQANSGAEGLRVARQQRPDAILLDVMMPDMDGPKTLKAIRADNTLAKIPVIFLTAKVQNSDRQRFTEMGVTTVLAKPFDPLQLGQQIAHALGWQL
jgi:CheY-like chemotaxis protein